MNTQFEKEGPIQGPAVERKASWTYEDRDYIWLSRLTYLFTPLVVCLMVPVAVLTMIAAFHADGLRQAALFIAAAVWTLLGSSVAVTLKSKYQAYLNSRFHGSRVRYLYSRPFFR